MGDFDLPPFDVDLTPFCDVRGVAGEDDDLLGAELLFPKVAALGLAEDAIVPCRLLSLYCPCTRNKPAVSLSSVELVVTADNLSRDGKVTSRGTLSTEPSSCKYQPRRKVYTVKPL